MPIEIASQAIFYIFASVFFYFSLVSQCCILNGIILSYPASDTVLIEPYIYIYVYMYEQREVCASTQLSNIRDELFKEFRFAR